MDPLKYQSSQKHGHYTIKLPFLRGAIKQHQHNQYLLELAICLSLCEFHSDSINQSKVKNFNPTLKNDTTTKPKYGICALFQRQSNLVLLHPLLFLNTMTPFTPSRCCVLRAQLWPLQSLPFLFSQNGLCSIYPFCPSLTVTQPTTTTIFLLWLLNFIQFCFNIGPRQHIEARKDSRPSVGVASSDLGMETGRVWVGFFHTRTQPVY